MKANCNDAPGHLFSGDAALVGWQLKRVTNADTPVNVKIKITVPLIKRVYPRLERKKRLTVSIRDAFVNPRPSCKRFTLI